MKAIYKYTGGGMIYGIPARDLKQKEWDKLPQHLQETGLRSGLYERVEGEKPMNKDKKEGGLE